VRSRPPLVALLLAVSVASVALASEGISRAETADAPEAALLPSAPSASAPAPSTDFVFRTTITDPLEARLSSARMAAMRSSLKPILTRDEKIVIIVCACVVGAILLFATFQIGEHNHPF
jgi:hypothetical protein